MLQRSAIEPAGADPAQRFLGGGIPLDLSVHAALRYIGRCRDLLTLVEGDELAELRLRTAVVVVAALAGIDAEQDACAVEALGRRVGGEPARAYGLVARHVNRQGPEYSAERVGVAEEILRIVDRHGEHTLAPIGHLLLLVGLLEQGQIRSLDIQLLELGSPGAVEEPARITDPIRWFHCLRSILDGDTERAEEHARAIYASAEGEGTEALALFTTHMGMIRWMQGRVEGAEEGLLAARRKYPHQVIWAASLAWLWTRQGRRDSAEALLRTLPAPDAIPRDRYWLSTVTVLAEIAAVTGPRARAAELQRLLEPFAAHLVPAGAGVAFWGTVARVLGRLEERLGMVAAARRHLELAIETSGRVGALAWHAEAQIELAEFAIRHGLADIPAYTLLAEARATSEARGFTALARRSMHRPQIRVLGRFEVVSLCGTSADWNSRKARELLKMLVAARGVAASREVFMDELWRGEPPSRLANRFSVAVNAIRRALDPDRLRPTQHHLSTEGDSVRLRLENLDVDLERFLRLADRPDEESLRAALRLYMGDAFSDEPYADWAGNVRDHARHVRRALEHRATTPPTSH